MKAIRQSLLLALALGLSTPVFADSGLELLGKIGYALAIAFGLAWFFERQKSSEHQARASAMAQKLQDNEKSVAQLQAIDQNREEALDRARHKIEEAERRRKETSDMLASLRIQVERVARVDGLTGVANRQQFDVSLVNEIKRSIRERKNISLLLVEIDGFFEYNDINGQQKGEFILQRVARSVSDSFRRAGDMVARVGEAKFSVLLPNTDEKTAQKFAEKLRRTIYGEALPFPASEIADRITVSIGLVTLPPSKLHKPENTIAMAENALRAAQQNGHNQVSVSQDAA